MIPLKEKLIHSEASTLSKAKLPNSSRSGYTNNVQKRLKALQQSEELTLLKQIDEVTRAYETKLQQRFSHICERGEWFRPKKELLDFIHKGDKDD